MIIRLFPPYPCITYNDDTSSHRSASRKRPKTVAYTSFVFLSRYARTITSPLRYNVFFCFLTLAGRNAGI